MKDGLEHCSPTLALLPTALALAAGIAGASLLGYGALHVPGLQFGFSGANPCRDPQAMSFQASPCSRTFTRFHVDLSQPRPPRTILCHRTGTITRSGATWTEDLPKSHSLADAITPACRGRVFGELTWNEARFGHGRAQTDVSCICRAECMRPRGKELVTTIADAVH